MQILLVGEYSRLHNSLKEGLTALGHNVVLVSDGDGFKQYDSDYSIAAAFVSHGIPNLFRQAIARLTGYDIATIERGIRLRRLLKRLKGFDIVQLINETPIRTTPGLERRLMEKLITQNKKAFLLCCSIDYTTVKYMLEGKFLYSLIDPYIADKSLAPQYKVVLSYGTPQAASIHQSLIEKVRGVIASDMDYYIPFHGHPKFLGMIPNPVNLSNLPYIELPVIGRIVIFLGINRWNYYPKGILFFEKALEIIREKYGDRVEILIAENIPYAEYINLYNRAHILLDQVYAFDQGYNALEAMAKGKAVFTGAEKEFMEYYGLTQRVAVNALPDTSSIVAELSYLIENPPEITAMGKRARAFVEKEHSHIDIARKYVEKWKK